MKNFFILIFIVGTIIIGGKIYISNLANKKNQIATVYEFSSGTSLKTLAKDLEDKGVISSSFWFCMWVKLNSDYSKYQAGTYKFENSSFMDVDELLKTGKTYSPILLSVTIPEGFTVKKIIARLEALDIGSKKELEELVKNKEFLKSKGISGPSVEGYLYPSTYVYRHKPTGKEVLSQMIDTFWSKLPEDYEAQVLKKGLSLYQAVIFASLIEQETFGESEMNKVSEVIWNRLKKNEPLGIDSSIIYGIEKYRGDIKAKDLKNKKNPYNTRVHRGLPPTAIGSPSIEALKSVLSPTSEGYFFFVQDTQDPSRHIFTSTLKEHNKYVKKLVKETSNGRVLKRDKK